MVKVTAADGHEYDKSTTANATVAPTNPFTTDNVVKNKSLGSDRLEFVTLVHYEFGLRGTIDKEFITKEYGFSNAEYDEYISDEGVVKALDERGVPIKRLTAVPEDLVRKAKLTPVQLVVANMMLDLSDTRSTKKKLQDTGLTTSQYNMWLRDENFSDYLRSRAESLIGRDLQHEALLALADKVMGGDMKAIAFYMELTGRHVPASANAAGNSANDVQQIIVRVVEILLEEIDDKELATTIVDRLKGLVTGQQVAGILPSPDIVQPEIAKGRVLSDEMQALTHKGLGYS